jgi:hypothetical protein
VRQLRAVRSVASERAVFIVVGLWAFDAAQQSNWIDFTVYDAYP